jgi:hypothetical protein
LAASVTAFADLGREMREAVTQLMRRSEWNWRFGPASIDDA